MSGDSIREVCPLFQVEGGGAIPTSPLQLNFHETTMMIACKLNALWHSRLPKIGLSHLRRYASRKLTTRYYVAEFDGTYFAVAIWSSPIALIFNNTGAYELRRLAIAPDAPKNTASRMLGWMKRDIKKKMPEVTRLISYQDTAVHSGTIYKAAGWNLIHSGGSSVDWSHHYKIMGCKSISHLQSSAPKNRWELELR
jgi:hypothetical protein